MGTRTGLTQQAISAFLDNPADVSKACPVLLHWGCINACMGSIDVVEPSLHGIVQVLSWLPKHNDDIDANQGTALICMVRDYR